MRSDSKNYAFVAVAVVLCLSLSVSGPPILAQSQRLSNGTFTSDIDGWNATILAGEGVAFSWDGAVGSPSPGSLRITVDGPTGSVYAEAQSKCFELVPDVSYELRVQALMRSDGGSFTCLPIILQFQGPGCTGERGFLGNTPSNQNGVWESWGYGIHPVTPASVRVGLYMSRTSPFDGTASCNFDSVVFGPASPTSPLEVPVLSGAGLAALGLLLASAGLLLLWGRRP